VCDSDNLAAGQASDKLDKLLWHLDIDEKLIATIPWPLRLRDDALARRVGRDYLAFMRAGGQSRYQLLTANAKECREAGFSTIPKSVVLVRLAGSSHGFREFVVFPWPATTEALANLNASSDEALQILRDWHETRWHRGQMVTLYEK
jgi:hypothetical protein